jgi:predicted nucleotidyltransferase
MPNVSQAPPTLSPEHPFVRSVLRELRNVYGTRLRAVALFGSAARRTAHPDSDLDLFIVVDDLPRGRRARLDTFDAVERGLAGEIETLTQSGVDVELSPILRTPDDLKRASPLMLDLTEDAVILEDDEGYLARALDDLRRRLGRLGARRIWVGTRWYWDLKPDYRRGEIIRL